MKGKMGIDEPDEHSERQSPVPEPSVPDNLLQTLKPSKTARNSSYFQKKSHSIKNQRATRTFANLISEETPRQSQTKALDNFLTQRLKNSPD